MINKEVILKVPKLVCNVCGNKKEVPKCCDKSMIVKEGYLLCCCQHENCGYEPIPECCGQRMEYIST
jgi:hypothetical protein